MPARAHSSFRTDRDRAIAGLMLFSGLRSAGVLPTGQEQRPHRHQSVVLDLIIDAAPGAAHCFGRRLDERRDIVPGPVDWEAGGAFVIPPGMWHAHYNQSGALAHLILAQDTGMQTQPGAG
jgi:uncharacterized RmlC-like cupin family protein